MSRNLEIKIKIKASDEWYDSVWKNFYDLIGCRVSELEYDLNPDYKKEAGIEVEYIEGGRQCEKSKK